MSSPNLESSDSVMNFMLAPEVSQCGIHRTLPSPLIPSVVPGGGRRHLGRLPREKLAGQHEAVPRNAWVRTKTPQTTEAVPLVDI